MMKKVNMKARRSVGKQRGGNDLSRATWQQVRL